MAPLFIKIVHHSLSLSLFLTPLQYDFNKKIFFLFYKLQVKKNTFPGFDF